MEAVFYKCPKCGFVHQVPSYWSGHSPEPEIEMPHFDLTTKEACSEMILKLVTE